MVGVEGVEDVVADVLQRLGGVGERADEGLEPLVQRVVAGFDQAVRVEGEQRPLGEFDLDLLERLAAHAQRHAGRHVEHQRRLTGLDQHRRQMPGVGERTASGDGVVHGVHAGREVHLGEVRVPGLTGRTGRLLDAARRAEAPRDLVQRGEHFRRLQVQQGQRAYGRAEFAHRHRRPEAPAHDVPDHQRGAVTGEFDDVEPVAADLRRRVAGQVAAGDVQARRLGVAGREQGALQYQRPFVLPAVQARVVDADGGPCGQFDREVPVAVAERLAALRPGELRESHDRVVGDHRHGQRGLHESALLWGHVLRAGGAQGVRAGRGEREVVDRADLDGLPGTAEGRTGDGAGEGDATQFGAAVGESGRGLVASQQALVEVDGGEVAEAGDDDVEEFASRGLQIEGVPYAGAGLVEQGEVAPGGGGLAGGGAAGGDVGAEPGDADGPAAAAVHAVEVDRPVPAFLGTGDEAGDVHVGDGLAALQHPSQRGRDALGLAARQIVVNSLAPVVVRGAAEDGGEPHVGPAHPQVRVDEQESERGLTKNRLRGGEVGLDAAQCADVHDDAHGGLVALGGARRHDVHLGQALLAARAVRPVRHPERHHSGPLAAVEDFGHLPLAALAQVGIDEGLYGVHADGACGGDAEELLGAQAPLVDQPAGTDGEGRDLDVVVDGTRRTALPHGVTGCRISLRGLPPRAVRRVLGLRGLRWYLAHANRPLQLTASGTGHRGRLPAVSSTTAPHDTVFTITARSRCFSDRSVTTLPLF